MGNRLAEALYAADQKINSKKTGGAALDINGYYMELEANHIAHLKDHVENDATALNEPLTFEETLQLPKYIDNFSDVLDVIRRKDGSIRFKLGAKINGYAIITEMVSKGRSSVHPVTAWKLPTSEYLRRYKNSGRSAVNASYTSNDAYYVGTNTDLAAENIIASPTQKVNEAVQSTRTLGELWEDEAAFMKKVAEEERYSIKYPAYSDEDIRENSVRLQKMSPVVELTGKEFPKGEKDLMTQVLEFFESLGNNVYSEEFGDVGLTKSSWRSERRHGMTPVKAISFAAVPDVIQKGAVVNVRTKANAYDRIVVAAPINIANEAGIPERYIMGVMLQRDNQSQRLYLHDVVLEKNQDLQNHAQTGPNAKFDNQTSWSSANLDISTILRNALAVKAEPARTLSEEIQRQMMQRGEAEASPYAGDPSAARQSRSAQDDSLTAESGGLRGLSLPTLEDGSGRKGSFGSPLLAQEDRVQG